MPKDYRLNVAKLRKLREAAGLSATQAAFSAGISERKLYRIEQGRYEPKLSMLLRLLDVYGVGPHDVVTVLAPIPSKRAAVKA